jgi:acetate kinase
MKALLEKRGTDPAAAMAVEMFCYQARKFVGAFAAALDGLDTLVFTGGIGERSAEVRAEICSGLAFLGIAIDAAANRANTEIISAAGSAAGSGCAVRVVKTDEDLMIARHTRRTVVPA